MKTVTGFLKKLVHNYSVIAKYYFHLLIYPYSGFLLQVELFNLYLGGLRGSKNRKGIVFMILLGVGSLTTNPFYFYTFILWLSYVVFFCPQDAVLFKTVIIPMLLGSSIAQACHFVLVITYYSKNPCLDKALVLSMDLLMNIINASKRLVEIKNKYG